MSRKLEKFDYFRSQMRRKCPENCICGRHTSPKRGGRGIPKPLSEETKKKISLALKSVPKSKEHGQNISKAKKGIPNPKVSLALKGKPNHHQGIPKWTPNLEPSFSLGYIVGATKGDGCVVRERCGMKGYGLKLSITSESFADIFACAAENIGLHATRWESKPYSTWATAGKLYNVQVNAVRLVEWYQSFDQDKLRELLNVPGFRRGFLKGFYDAEGNHAYFNNGKRDQERVRFSNTSLQIMEDMIFCLSLEGFLGKRICASKRLRFGKTEYTINLYDGKARRFLEALDSERIKE